MTAYLLRRVAFLFVFMVSCGSVPVLAEDRGHPDHFKREGGVPPSIQALATTGGGVLYAGSFGFGVFFSDDYGETWEAINNGLGDRFILCLSADEKGTVYAGTVRGGVFRTKEDGKTWESIKAGLRFVEVKSLLAHHGIMYAGTGKGVYQWDEAAHRWSVVAPGLEQVLVASLAMTNTSQLFAGTAGKGLYQIDATKYGKWQKVGDPLVDPKEHLTHTHIRVTTVSPQQHLYVGTQDGGVYRSKDSGKTWKPVGRSLPNDSIRGIVVTRAALFVATGRGIFKNNFQNAKWVPVNNGLTELSIQVMMASSKGELYVGTSAGAFRSQDDGNHWTNISETLGMHYTMPRPYF
ncbi:MAG: hypothetical protein OXI53_02475 [Nitrospira sp.]|nr:hypothetical protein [Nitrospira sp.]MDE0487364.1 hypothetical protein [Nitrospira sp.]